MPGSGIFHNISYHTTLLRFSISSQSCQQISSTHAKNLPHGVGQLFQITVSQMFSFINVRADSQLLTSPHDLSLPVYVLVALNRQQRSRCLKRPIRSDPPLRALKSLLTDHQRKGPTSTHVDKGADTDVRGRTGYFGCAAPHPPGKTHNSPKQPQGFAAVQERLHLGLYQKDTKLVITVNFTHSSVACLPWKQPSSEGLPRSRRESRDRAGTGVPCPSTWTILTWPWRSTKCWGVQGQGHWWFAVLEFNCCKVTW